MPGESTYLENSILNAIRGLGFPVTTVYASLHTADPSGTGASEVAAGTYQRVALTFGTPALGSMTGSGTISFTVPAGTTVSYVGLWDAPSSGNFYIGGALNASATFTQQGNYNLTSLSFNQTQ